MRTLIFLLFCLAALTATLSSAKYEDRYASQENLRLKRDDDATEAGTEAAAGTAAPGEAAAGDGEEAPGPPPPKDTHAKETTTEESDGVLPVLNGALMCVGIATAVLAHLV